MSLQDQINQAKGEIEGYENENSYLNHENEQLIEIEDLFIHLNHKVYDVSETKYSVIASMQKESTLQCVIHCCDNAREEFDKMRMSAIIEAARFRIHNVIGSNDGQIEDNRRQISSRWSDIEQWEWELEQEDDEEDRPEFIDIEN